MNVNDYPLPNMGPKSNSECVATNTPLPNMGPMSNSEFVATNSDSERCFLLLESSMDF